MITTGEILARNARKFPEREGLVFEDKRYTYAALNEAVNRLASSLTQMGLEKGEKVGILSLNSDSFVISYFAVMKAGGIVVPLNYRLAPPEAFYILDNCDSRFFIVGEEFLALALEIRDRLPHGGEVDPGGRKGLRRLRVPPRPHRLGRPRGARRARWTSSTNRPSSTPRARPASPRGRSSTTTATSSIATAMLSELAMRETDRILHVAPLYDAADLHLFLWPGTLVGATHVVMRDFIPETVLKTIEKERVTHFFGASTMYLLLMQVPRLNNTT